MKNGSQQAVNAPMMTPRVLVALRSCDDDNLPKRDFLNSRRLCSANMVDRRCTAGTNSATEKARLCFDDVAGRPLHGVSTVSSSCDELAIASMA